MREATKPHQQEAEPVRRVGLNEKCSASSVRFAQSFSQASASRSVHSMCSTVAANLATFSGRPEFFNLGRLQCSSVALLSLLINAGLRLGVPSVRVVVAQPNTAQDDRVDPVSTSILLVSKISFGEQFLKATKAKPPSSPFLPVNSSKAQQQRSEPIRITYPTVFRVEIFPPGTGRGKDRGNSDFSIAYEGRTWLAHAAPRSCGGSSRCLSLRGRPSRRRTAR